MSNAWGITEAEYQVALNLGRAGDTPRSHSADYWQLCEFYRGRPFNRDAAARAARRIRGTEPAAA